MKRVTQNFTEPKSKLKYVELTFKNKIQIKYQLCTKT